MGLKDLSLWKQFVSPIYVEIRPRWDWKRGRIASLGIEIKVEIRPRWDWKLKDYISVASLEICWNQTKMGLKVKFKESSVLCKDYVEIRPRWDWKRIRVISPISPVLVEIRPRWDWKFCYYHFKSAFEKSWNQTKMGLKEQCKELFSHFSKSWNQTKMGLKGRNGYSMITRHYMLKSDQDGIESHHSEIWLCSNS